jgi:hypothetical protein
MIKEWKDVVGYEGYYKVSNYGDVYSIRSNKVLSHRPARGYKKVALKVKGTIKEPVIHRLVAEAFIGKPNGKYEVNHIDLNKHNNRVDNLEWITHSENLNHYYGSYN